MNHVQHDPSKWDDFETQLKSLAPRPPRAAAPLLEYTGEPNQVAGGRSWWSVDVEAPYAIYRTVGLSASIGALFGAACTVLILRWSEVPDPNTAAPVAVSSNDTVGAIDNKRDSIVAPEDNPSIAHFESHPRNTSVHVSSSADLPRDWLEDLRNLKPGTLEVGTRLVSRQSTRQRSTRNESTFGSVRVSRDEPPESIAEISNGSSRVNLDSAPLPQREWMRQLLNSPNEFF